MFQQLSAAFIVKHERLPLLFTDEGNWKLLKHVSWKFLWLVRWISMSDLPTHSGSFKSLFRCCFVSVYPSALSPYGTYGILDLSLNFLHGRDYCSCEYIRASHKNSRIALVALLPNLTIVQFWQHEPTWNHILHLQNRSISVFENSRQIRFSTEWRFLTHRSLHTHLYEMKTQQLACTAFCGMHMQGVGC